MIYFPEGMELEEVSVVFQGSVNDVVVCRDRRSAAGTLYTLLAIHDRECARKMLEVMENGQKGGEPSCLFQFAQNETTLFAFPYREERRFSAFARGLSLTNYNPKGFMDILEGMWWRLDRTLDLADTYHSATSTYLDCIRNGVTTVFDHHASYGAITGSLHEISRAADLMGIRTCLCYEVSDRDGADKCRESIEENLSFIHTAAGRDDDMQHAMMGMHAAFTLSDKTLEACLKDLPQGVGCHVHVAEGMDDATHSLRTYGCSVVRRLMDRGVLGPQSIAAHSIHLNWEDMQLLKESQTMVVHNPESNMGNAVGCANIPSYYQAGLCLGLGTDGYTSDMLESYKAANALAKHNAKDPTVGWTEIPSMLFEGNPALAGRYFRTPLGVLKEQAAADIIIRLHKVIRPRVT